MTNNQDDGGNTFLKTSIRILSFPIRFILEQTNNIYTLSNANITKLRHKITSNTATTLSQYKRLIANKSISDVDRPTTSAASLKKQLLLAKAQLNPNKSQRSSSTTTTTPNASPAPSSSSSSQQQEDGKALEEANFIFLCKAWFSHCEILYASLLTDLDKVTNYLKYWEKRYSNPIKYAKEFRPNTWIKMVHDPLSHLDWIEVKITKLKHLQKLIAVQIGKLKRMMYAFGKSKNPEHMRKMMKQYTAINSKFLKTMMQMDKSAEETKSTTTTTGTTTSSASGVPPMSPASNAASMLFGTLATPPPPHAAASFDDLVLSPDTPPSPTIVIPAQSDSDSTHATTIAPTSSRVSYDEYYDILIAVCDEIQAYQDTKSSTLYPLSSPSYFNRRWLMYTCIGTAVFFGCRFVYKHSPLAGSNDLTLWYHQAKDGIKEFVFTHIYEPLEGIFSQIFRNRYKTVFDPKELEDAKISMHRMLLDIGNELNPTASPEQKMQIAEKASQYDLSILTPQLEEEIKSPIKNALFGQLVRMALVQGLRLRLDMLIALDEIDTILKANQMNMYITATIPAVILFVAGVAYMRRAMFESKEKQTAYGKIRTNLREVERILNKALPSSSHLDEGGEIVTLSYEELGLMLLCLSKLEQNVQHLRNVKVRVDGEGNVKAQLREDLKELESNRLSVLQKLRTIERMWRTYKFLSNTE